MSFTIISHVFLLSVKISHILWFFWNGISLVCVTYRVPCSYLILVGMYRRHSYTWTFSCMYNSLVKNYFYSVVRWLNHSEPFHIFVGVFPCACVPIFCLYLCFLFFMYFIAWVYIYAITHFNIDGSFLLLCYVYLFDLQYLLTSDYTYITVAIIHNDCRTGSQLIWIAPSGGRDRPDPNTGEWYPVRFTISPL